MNQAKVIKKNLSPTLGQPKVKTAKDSLDKVVKPNLKNIGRSIRPTVKSKLYK